jgi:hypothetical protein
MKRLKSRTGVVVGEPFADPTEGPNAKRTIKVKMRGMRFVMRSP